MLYDVARKVLQRMNIIFKDFGENEIEERNDFTASIIRPFVFLDMAYQLFCEIDEKKMTFARKKHYNILKENWNSVYRVYHKGMTDDDYMYLSDFEDKVSDILTPYKDKMIDIMIKSLVDTKGEKEDIARIYCSEAIALSCARFIAYEMSQVNDDYTRMLYVPKVGNVFAYIKGDKPEMSPIMQHLEIISNQSFLLAKEMIKQQNGGKFESIRFHENEEFGNAFAEMITKYIDIDINDIEK